MLADLDAAARRLRTAWEHALRDIQISVVDADGEPVGAMVVLEPSRPHPRSHSPTEAIAQALGMAGASPAFLEAVRRARQIADAGTHVVVSGESGTGKTHLARAMAGPAASTADVLTDDWRTALDAPGTVVIEHVDALSSADQLLLAAKLDRPRAARVIGVAAGGVSALRPELASRLHAGAINLPPLRDRPGDLELLVAAWARARAHERASAVRVLPETIAELAGRDLPGNVAELYSLLDAANLARRGPVIHPADLPAAPPSSSLPGIRLEEIERDAIRRALAQVGGSVTRAADLLGVSRATLYRRLRADRLLGKARSR